MKHISEFNLKVGNESLLEPKHIEIDLQTKHIVNTLFMRLKGIIPAFNAAAHNDEELGIIKREWALGFIQAGLSDLNAIDQGLNKLRLQDNTFMISIGEFIKLCKLTPGELGLPTLEKAYDEACKASHPCGDKVFSHESVEHAWRQTGSYNLSHLPRANSFPIFQRNYEMTVQMLLDGKPLADINKAITQEPEQKPMTRSVGLEALRNLKGSLGI